jgi:hypothetical protein
MMMVGKIIGLIVIGAITVIPVYVFLGSLAAPFKVKEKVVFIVSALIAYALIGAVIFMDSGASGGGGIAEDDCRPAGYNKFNDC